MLIEADKDGDCLRQNIFHRKSFIISHYYSYYFWQPKSKNSHMNFSVTYVTTLQWTRGVYFSFTANEWVLCKEWHHCWVAEHITFNPMIIMGLKLTERMNFETRRILSGSSVYETACDFFHGCTDKNCK